MSQQTRLRRPNYSPQSRTYTPSSYPPIPLLPPVQARHKRGRADAKGVQKSTPPPGPCWRTDDVIESILAPNYCPR
eukprot:8292020-Pyramimonas_sp.AAC.1